MNIRYRLLVSTLVAACVFPSLALTSENQPTVQLKEPFGEMIKLMHEHAPGKSPIWHNLFLKEYEETRQRLVDVCKEGGGLFGESGETLVYLLEAAQLNPNCGHGNNCLNIEYQYKQLQELLDRANGTCREMTDVFVSKTLPYLFNELKIGEKYQIQLDEYLQAVATEEKKREASRLATEKQVEEERIRRQAQEEAKFMKLIKDNNLEIIYRSGDFAIGKNKGGQFQYIKNGSFVNSSEVKDEIEGYNRALVYQKELENTRQKNIGTKWFATASGVGNCVVTQIRDIGRDEDGSAMFSIQYSCRGRGRSSGSSGADTLYCGFNRTNYINNTSFKARCQ